MNYMYTFNVIHMCIGFTEINISKEQTSPYLNYQLQISFYSWQQDTGLYSM